MGAAQYRKPQWRKQVEEMLRLYPAYKRSAQMNVIELFPSLVTSFSGRVQGGESEFVSSTEKFGIKRAEQKRLVYLIEMGLSCLNQDEREVIEATYFTMNRLPYKILSEELGLSKTKYFRLKRVAIEKLATLLFLA